MPQTAGKRQHGEYPGSPCHALTWVGRTLTKESNESIDPRVLLNELAVPYYFLLWSTLTGRERLALYQLAKDGWINTKNHRAIQELRRKRVIRGLLRVMNESFRLFVLRVQDQREIAEWERQGEQSSWRSLKIGLLATIVALTAWLFYAQKDLFTASVGYIVTIGGAITAITNALLNIKGRAPSVTKPAETSGL